MVSKDTLGSSPSSLSHPPSTKGKGQHCHKSLWQHWESPQLGLYLQESCLGF